MALTKRFTILGQHDPNRLQVVDSHLVDEALLIEIHPERGPSVGLRISPDERRALAARLLEGLPPVASATQVPTVDDVYRLSYIGYSRDAQSNIGFVSTTASEHEMSVSGVNLPSEWFDPRSTFRITIAKLP